MSRIVIAEIGCSSIELEFDQPVITIGRVRGNDITLNHSSVSKRHAIIRFSYNYITITDLDSRNGIYVNNQLIKNSVTIGPKDVIRIVDYTMSFERVDATATDSHNIMLSPNDDSANGISSQARHMVRNQTTPQSTRDTGLHLNLPTPDAAELRVLVNAVFRTDSDFDAFCGDHFPKVKLKFGDGMIRTAKTTLLLEMISRDLIFSKLNKYHTEEVAEYQILKHRKKTKTR